ncbi:MAG: pseudouridine synthase [Rhizobacter sp.]|nr:pseudouridine synthase [Rhizobacter sp.]
MHFHSSPQPPLDIVHVDEALVVAVKPAGLPCVPARAAHLNDCLSQQLQSAWPDALIVHRLDMATSGLVVMARGKQAQRLLSIAFADRAVHKRYVAIVHGRVELPESGVAEIDLPLLADWPNRPKQKVDRADGKPSLTRYRVLMHDGANDTTRLSLEPVTGRSHQLRVHLQAIGHPIVGDALYAIDASLEAGREGPAKRLMLHASELSFAHPLTGAAMAFSRPPPF